jgi:hypothetical protein
MRYFDSARLSIPGPTRFYRPRRRQLFVRAVIWESIMGTTASRNA